MNKKYRLWLNAVREDSIAKFYDQFFWTLVSSGQFKKMYQDGMSPEMAAFQLIPW